MGAYFVILHANDTWQWFYQNDHADPVAQGIAYSNRDDCLASIKDIQGSGDKPIFDEPPRSN